MGYNNIKREFNLLIAALEIGGFDAAFHAFRRFFGKNYLKNGGNVIYLQRLFGHSGLATTKMYLEDIDTQDLQLIHVRSSVLSRMRS